MVKEPVLKERRPPRVALPVTTSRLLVLPLSKMFNVPPVIVSPPTTVRVPGDVPLIGVIVPPMTLTPPGTAVTVPLPTSVLFVLIMTLVA